MRIGKATAAIAALTLLAALSTTPAQAAFESARSGNLTLARQETHRLVSSVVLPDGSTEQRRSAGLNYPRFGAAFFRSREKWQVPLATDAARSWLASNPPKGLKPKHSGTEPGAPDTFESRFLDPGPSPAWLGRAHLVVLIAPAADGSTKWTVSGQAKPLSDGAGRDSNEGYPFAARPVDGCPSHERGISHVANGVAGPSRHFIPAGRVTAAIVCRYSGDRRLRPGKPKERLALLASHRYDMGEAERLAKLARGVSVHGIASYPPPGGRPPDYSAIVLALHYASGRDVDLRLSIEDFGAVLSNGTISMVSWLYGPGFFRFTRALGRAARR